MTAEVLTTDNQGPRIPVSLQMRGSREHYARALEPFKKGKIVRRARRTIRREVAKGSRGATRARWCM
jgi:hypothetical protein